MILHNHPYSVEKRIVYDLRGTNCLRRKRIDQIIQLAFELVDAALPDNIEFYVQPEIDLQSLRERNCGSYFRVKSDCVIVSINTTLEYLESHGGADVIFGIFHEFRHFFQFIRVCNRGLEDPNLELFDKAILMELLRSFLNEAPIDASEDDSYFFKPHEIDADAYSLLIIEYLYDIEIPYRYKGKRKDEYLKIVKRRESVLKKRYSKMDIRRIASKYDLPPIWEFKQIKA